MLGFRLVLDVIHFVDVALLFLVALQAVIDACRRAGGLLEQTLQLQGVGICWLRGFR